MNVIKNQLKIESTSVAAKDCDLFSFKPVYILHFRLSSL